MGFVNAQENGDHLKPVDGIYDLSEYQFEYYSKIRKVLFEGLTEYPVIRFQVVSSFTPESVVDIEFNRKEDKHYIVYHICTENIWYSKSWEKIKVRKYRAEIDKESIEVIKILFETVIAQTKFPEVDSIGLDGADYYFSIRGLKSGTVWSPAEGTKMRELVKIGYELKKLAKSKNTIDELDEKLKSKIESLTNKFK